MIVRLHHVGVVTSDLETTSARLAAVLGLPEPQPRHVSTDAYELRTVMVPTGGGTHLQLIEPARGAYVAELAERGDGAAVEIAFEVADIAAASEEVRNRDLAPVDLVNDPLKDGFAHAASGSRYLYLPAGAVLGTRVELIQPG